MTVRSLPSSMRNYSEVGVDRARGRWRVLRHIVMFAVVNVLTDSARLIHAESRDTNCQLTDTFASAGTAA